MGSQRKERVFQFRDTTKKDSFFKSKEGLFLIGGIFLGMIVMYFIIPILIIGALAGLVWYSRKKNATATK